MNALIVAAMMMADHAPPTAFDRTVAAIAAGEAGDRRHAAQSLVDAGARPLDGTDDLVLRWGTRHRAAPYRDRALGPGYRRVIVKPGTIAQFEQIFMAGQRARVAVVASARAPVDLRVTDTDGAAQCPASAAIRCDWVPLWTTRFQIAVRNPGAAPASYTIVVE